MRRSLQLKHTALLAALASIYPLQAWAAAGVTQFSTGEVSLQRASAASSPLPRGSNVESGDLIITGAAGRTQLRFTDGGMVSLQPNSQFKITRYTDSGNAQNDSFLVDLARGGMRALTGLIGKRNRENYKVTTTTATIGIRGSGFSMAYNPDGTLAVTTELDAIDVCTQAGCVGLNVGESALVTSANERPTRTRERAHWNPPNPRRLVTARNDDSAADGKAATVPRQVFAGLAFTGAGLPVRDNETSVHAPRLYLNGAAVEQGGTLLGYQGANNDRGSEGSIHSQSEAYGKIEDGDYIRAGLWDNATWTGSAGGTLSKSGFVLGQATPESAMASLSNNLANSASMRAQYDLVTGTPVLSSLGASGTLESTSKVIVDFRAAYNQLDVALDVKMPYEFPTNQSFSSGSGGMLYNMRGTVNAESSGFKGNLSISGNSYYVGNEQYATHNSVINNCNPCGIGNVAGFFGGSSANHLGLSFTGDVGGQHGNLAGAGIFARGSVAATPTTTATESSNYKAMVTHSGQNFSQAEYSSIYVGEGTSMQFQGNFLNSIDTLNSYQYSYAKAATASQHHGAVGQPVVGDAEGSFIGWGYWSAGSSTYHQYPSNTTANIEHFHYVAGKPTSVMPTQGYGTYALLGGTAPTATNGATTITGQLLPSSNVQVNFYDGNLRASIDTQFGTNQISIVQNASFYIGCSGCCGNNPTFQNSNSTNKTFINGMFTGNNAQRAGLTYGKDNTTVGNIRGAAVFQRTSNDSTYYND